MSDNKTQEHHPLITLKLDNFTDSPGKFCMSYGFDITFLTKSFIQAGLINKPYILKNNKGDIDIVTGYRRILALKDLKIKEVTCFDLTDSGLSQLDILKLAIQDNMFTREFNVVEKSMILNMLSEYIQRDEIIREHIAYLNISKKDYDLIFKIDKLEDFLKQSLANNTLGLKALEQLLQLDKDDLLISYKYISELKLNYNQQIQLFDYTKDLSRIENVSITNFLNRNEYSDLLMDSKKNTPQKARELIDTLRIRRNPNYSRYKRLFEKGVKRLQLPANIRVRNPEYFESEGYQLNIDFTDGNDLKNSLKSLLNKKELDNIGDPWSAN